MSGGQTGADRAGLDAAVEAGILHGGWCPRGRFAEDGKIPAKYRLRQTMSSFYTERTEKNVLDSDMTAVFTFGPPLGGSASTVIYAKRHGKPFRHFDLNGKESVLVKDFCKWLESLEKDEIVLNIAGSRESTGPGAYEKVKNILAETLAEFHQL